MADSKHKSFLLSFCFYSTVKGAAGVSRRPHDYGMMAWMTSPEIQPEDNITSLQFVYMILSSDAEPESKIEVFLNSSFPFMGHRIW